MIGPIRNVPALRVERPKADDSSASGADAKAVRRLDPVGPIPGSDDRSSSERRKTGRHNAAFVTHLIATRENVEQLRARRRIDPALGAASYASPVRHERAHAVGKQLALST